MHTRHVNTGITSRERSDNRPEKLRPRGGSCSPTTPIPKHAQFSRRPPRAIVYSLLCIIYDSLSLLMKAELKRFRKKRWCYDPRNIPFAWNDSIPNSVFNISFLPMWWMAHWEETCWWGNTKKIVVVAATYCDSCYLRRNADESP